MLPLSGWFLASVFWRDSPSLWSEEHWHYMLGWHCFSRESSVWSITARAQGEQLGNLQPERREKNRLWSGQVGRWDSPHKGWLRRSFPWAELSCLARNSSLLGLFPLPSVCAGNSLCSGPGLIYLSRLAAAPVQSVPRGFLR